MRKAFLSVAGVILTTSVSLAAPQGYKPRGDDKGCSRGTPLAICAQAVGAVCAYNSREQKMWWFTPRDKVEALHACLRKRGVQ
jgi:hypothetical protein